MSRFTRVSEEARRRDAAEDRPRDRTLRDVEREAQALGDQLRGLRRRTPAPPEPPAARPGAGPTADPRR